MQAPLFLLPSQSATFNGVIVSRRNNFFKISRPAHLANLQPINSNAIEKVAYIVKHVRAAYIAANCLFDMNFGFLVGPKYPRPDVTLNESLNKFIKNPNAS